MTTVSKSQKKSRKHHRASDRRPMQRRQANEVSLAMHRSMKWATIGLAAALFLAPFATGYAGAPAALGTSLILAVVIGALGYRMKYRWAALAGAAVVAAPWLLGFSGVAAALATCLLLGTAVVVVDGYASLLVPDAKKHPALPHLDLKP